MAASAGRDDFGRLARRLSSLAALALGWRPDEFWRATPAELAAILLPGAEAAAPPDAALLARLMEAHPDG